MRLAGACNRCGVCCTLTIDGRATRCEHLEVDGALGTPQATSCRRYVSRYDQMPIWLLDARTGQPFLRTVCLKGTPEETASIITRGIGRGCPLEVVDV
jgi:hypothetical protein